MTGFDQPVHWIILLVLAGLLFGGYKKLPEMARSAGRSMRVFKTELKGLEDDDQARASAAQPAAYTQPVAPGAPGSVPAPVQPAAPAPYATEQYAPPVQYAPPAQYAPPTQYAPPVEPAAAAPVAPAPPVAVAVAPAGQPPANGQSAYVPTEPVTDPTAPPRA